MKMQMIDIQKIKTDNKYLRLDSNIENLAASIKSVGLIHPLSINSKYQLLAGGRRFSALKDLGFNEVPVIIVDHDDLKQELVSIDENISRKPLSKLELENALNRGREIYESLNPTANKVSIKTDEEKKKNEEDTDENSYAAVTSQQTGLSKNVIRSAIQRDELSSPKIKKARSQGELNASQVNEVIRLSKKDQEKILPFIQDKTVKDIRKIVNHAKNTGLDDALSMAQELQNTPRELVELIRSLKKTNKSLGKYMLEDFDYNGKESEILNKELSILKQLTDELFNNIDTNILVASSQRQNTDHTQNWQ